MLARGYGTVQKDGIFLILFFSEKLNKSLLGPQKAMNLHLKKKPLDQKRLSNELKSLIGLQAYPPRN